MLPITVSSAEWKQRKRISFLFSYHFFFVGLFRPKCCLARLIGSVGSTGSGRWGVLVVGLPQLQPDLLRTPVHFFVHPSISIYCVRLLSTHSEKMNARNCTALPTQKKTEKRVGEIQLYPWRERAMVGRRKWRKIRSKRQGDKEQAGDIRQGTLKKILFNFYNNFCFVFYMKNKKMMLKIYYFFIIWPVFNFKK